jgi:hypothetical protein
MPLSYGQRSMQIWHGIEWGRVLNDVEIEYIVIQLSGRWKSRLALGEVVPCEIFMRNLYKSYSAILPVMMKRSFS